MAALDNPIFTDANKAREHLEAIRWPNGKECPHCGNVEQDSIRSLKGKAHRVGVYQCNSCREQFTVTVGTVFERSKIPLNKWLLATHLMTSSKKGISAHQLHRMLGLTYKSAWFMCHRIREAMREDNPKGPLGGAGQIVQADETYLGEVENPRTVKVDGAPFTKGGKSGISNKRTVLGLVERGGKARMFHMVGGATAHSVREIIVRHADRASVLHTDESRLYIKLGKEFSAHASVNHSAREYSRDGVTTNHIEGVFSVFKRGMKGVYQHCAEKHLHRYLCEFEFRFNNRTALNVSDVERRDNALAGIAGKRLTYRRIDETHVA